MKISWKTVDDGMKELVYAYDELIGYVQKNWGAQKWKIVPYFNLVASFGNEIDQKYDGAYEAGKALHAMWEREQLYALQKKEEEKFDETYWEDDDQHWDPRTTQPLNMGKLWSKP